MISSYAIRNTLRLCVSVCVCVRNAEVYEELRVKRASRAQAGTLTGSSLGCGSLRRPLEGSLSVYLFPRRCRAPSHTALVLDFGRVF